LNVTVSAVLLVALAGCGEQDLYKPPDSPYDVVGRLSLPSNTEDVAILGSTAVVACGQAGLVVVDVSTPNRPLFVDLINTEKYAEAVKIAAVPHADRTLDIAFVVEGTEGITTYDFTDPDSLLSFGQGTTAVDGNGLFIEVPEDPTEPFVVYLAENWKGLRIFESVPGVPGLLQYNGVFSSTRGYAKSVSVRDGFAYVADDEMGLAVLDVRVRVLGSVKVLSACDSPGNARGIDIEGDHAFIADGPQGLVVMRIDGAAEPVPVGQLMLPGYCRAIVVRDQRAFIAAQDGGIHIVDVSSPSAPVLLGTVVTSYAVGVATSKNGVVAVADRDEGLIVLGGGGAFRDAIPPGAVPDLVATPLQATAVRLQWRAPGDDRFYGTASLYDIRYASEAITEESWDLATACEGEPTPEPSGTSQTFVVAGLVPATEYFFALRTADAASNWSVISNSPSALTPEGNVAPTLSDPVVQPAAGSPLTLFTFEVVYTDGDGDEPTEAAVHIDGTPHAMTYVTGAIPDGALYRYETTLASGQYEHSFAFNDGHHPTVTTPVAQGPLVGEVFTMGSPAGEPGRDVDEVQHLVLLSREVAFSDHEVTQAEYDSIMGANPSRFVDPDRPVENVTWHDAIAYCNGRSSRDGYTPAYLVNGPDVTWDPDADGYRLPTEAEWEWACRAGSATAFANGPITEETCTLDPVLDAIGWYCGNAGSATHLVKGKAANAWNLYDMHGNVWEWCWDWYVADLGDDAVADPSGPASGSQRVIRGGSWYYFARDCRSASRAPYWPNSKDDIVGFRVVRTIQ
jgi:formylglycine-generating enzyme required for sulfatase activity